MVRRSICFTVANAAFLLLLALAMLLPFLHVVAKSLSSEAAVVSGLVAFLPVDFQTGTFRYVLSQPQTAGSFRVSVFVTVVGTLLSLLLTTIAAYPLSKPSLRGRKWLLLAFVFTMLFGGGMIPNYLLVKRLGLTNTVWAMILPSLLNVFNMLVMKSFFEELPASLEEAAKMDGCSNAGVLFRIVLPVSLPVLATVALFYSVSYWNDFFTALLYVSKAGLKPLQLYLYELLTRSLATPDRTLTADEMLNLTPDCVRAATVVITTAPILAVYPFLQKYFVKGMILGSVKG